MTVRIPAFGLLLSMLCFLLFSCEKEETPEQNLYTIALKIESAGGEVGVGELRISRQNGSSAQSNTVSYNTIEEIQMDLKTEETYLFEVEDPNLGKIKMFATGHDLQNATLQNPFILQFEHYKNHEVVTFQVNAQSVPSSRNRYIDLTLMQTHPYALYHIDWGDGSEEVAEGPGEIQAPADRIVHRYAATGDYTITVSTTKPEDVTGVDLQITGNGKGDRIETLQMEELPNLTYLSLGDNDLENIDPLLERYPNLTHLSIRFGKLTSIDVSKNPLLQLLIVDDNFDTTIKELSTLSRLKFLGLTGTVEDLNLAAFPELYHLTLRGHKATSLDVTQNIKLTTLVLQLNELETINLTSNVALETLYIINNSLTGLDLTNNPEIVHLNLYANYIEELDLSFQDKLEYLNLSSVHLKQVAAPESLDFITNIDLSEARFLNETELLDAVFLGQEHQLKTGGQIIFHDQAVILDEQIEKLRLMVDNQNWNINIPE